MSELAAGRRSPKTNYCSRTRVLLLTVHLIPSPHDALQDYGLDLRCILSLNRKSCLAWYQDAHFRLIVRMDHSFVKM